MKYITLEKVAFVQRSSCGVKLWLSILASLPFSTLALWCRVFHSRVFHPCIMVPRFPLPRFPPPAFLTLPRFPLLRFQSPRFANRSLLDFFSLVDWQRISVMLMYDYIPKYCNYPRRLYRRRRGVASVCLSVCPRSKTKMA